MRNDEPKGQKKVSRDLQVLKLHLKTGRSSRSVATKIPSIRIPLPIKKKAEICCPNEIKGYTLSPQRVAVITLINHMQILSNVIQHPLCHFD